MHGVKKFEGSEEAQLAKKQATLKKIQKYKTLLEMCVAKKNKKEYDEEALTLTEELINANGDCYTMWNFRRLTLVDMFAKADVPSQEAAVGVDDASVEPSEEDKKKAVEESQQKRKKILERELVFTQGAIAHNPKSYWCWNHREWITTLLDQMNQCDWQKELRLCGLMLNSDNRNFHCWNYRRYVAKHCSDLEQELAFTQEKIEQNFSNYSAWHQRSKLLPLLYKDDHAGYLQAIERELEQVQNAFYTEPADQSAWFYHRWLVSQHPDQAILEREVERCNEILQMLEEEEGSPIIVRKWPILTKVFLMQKLEQLEGVKGTYESELKQNLAKLKEIDPYHVEYYKYVEEHGSNRS